MARAMRLPSLPGLPDMFQENTTDRTTIYNNLQIGRYNDAGEVKLNQNVDFLSTLLFPSFLSFFLFICRPVVVFLAIVIFPAAAAAFLFFFLSFCEMMDRQLFDASESIAMIERERERESERETEIDQGKTMMMTMGRDNSHIVVMWGLESSFSLISLVC
jgi:hypothetical protein